MSLLDAVVFLKVLVVVMFVEDEFLAWLRSSVGPRLVKRWVRVQYVYPAIQGLVVNVPSSISFL